MSDEGRKIQERFESFAAGFLRPLLEGGPAVVGKPVSPGMLDDFALSRPADTEVDRAIHDALHAAASDVTLVRAVPWPDRGLAAVAMASHDLIAVTDPKLDRWLARNSREEILEWVDWLLEQAGEPRTRGAALARHAVVARVLEMRRKDVVVTNWAYTYRFFGRPVPKRVVAMPKLRFVKQKRAEHTVVELFQELEDELGTASRMRTLLARSPVTELLRTDLAPDLPLGVASLAVLSDDLLRNGVARELGRQGDAPAAPLGAAIRNLAEQRPPPRLLYYALALAWEMHVIAVLDARAGAALPYGRPRDDDARLFAAILPAMLGAPDDLGALLDLDPDDMAALRRRAPALDRAAGESASRLAVELIDYAEPPRLDHERDDTPGRAGGTLQRMKVGT